MRYLQFSIALVAIFSMCHLAHAQRFGIGTGSSDVQLGIPSTSPARAGNTLPRGSTSSHYRGSKHYDHSYHRNGRGHDYHHGHRHRNHYGRGYYRGGYGYGGTSYGLGLSIGWPSYSNYGYSSFTYGYGLPYSYGSLYGAVPYNSYGYGYAPYPAVYPPAVLPSDSLYGPAAAQRSLGMEFRNPQQPVVDDDVIIAADPPANVDPADAVRKSNSETRDLAWRFIEFGDARFAAQEFAAALQRYKAAAELAPDVAETYFRQGHTYAILGQYEKAANEYRRGLAHDPDWARSAFQMRELYKDNRAAWTGHLERLAEEALQNQDDADLLFVMGVQLFFDGKKDRAALFFRQADRLSADSDYLAGFLAASK